MILNPKMALRILAVGFAVAAAAAWKPGLPPGQEFGFEIVKTVVISAESGWADTGLDVVQGDEFHIRGYGEVSLQRGNPAANCGPAGLDFMTVQQPIRDRNLGALIGKVAQLVSVRTDEDSGEEIRDEIVRYFFIGAVADVAVPINGRLYLGLNEDIVADNGGQMTAVIFIKRHLSDPVPGLRNAIVLEMQESERLHSATHRYPSPKFALRRRASAAASTRE